jgi:NADH dehydrogenase
MKKVIVVGMGFGGVRVVSGLSGKGLDVLVLDRRNFTCFSLCCIKWRQR